MISLHLRPATNLSEFLLRYGYIHGYTRSNYYNEITYEFDIKVSDIHYTSTIP